MIWDNEFALDILPRLLIAFVQYTLVITVLATLLAAVLGLVMAVIRYSKVPVLSPVTSGFLQFIRATPIPVQLFFVFYVLPDMGVLIGAMTTGVLVLGVHYASYFAEVYRGGIEAIPKGQWEATTALSLPMKTVWQRVVLPQAVRKILPSLGNYVISMFKEVPFLLFISVPEMVTQARDIGGSAFRYLEPFTICGIIYLLASYPASVAMRKLETRLETA
jgi:polar amino acid transport system permease protein